MKNTLARHTNEYPYDVRAEVQALYRFAAVANLCNFDPRITLLQTNEAQRMVEFGTPTHGGCIIGGNIELVHSFYDGSDTRVKPEAADQWYQCTGKWTATEAARETLDILRRLGYEATASSLEKTEPRYDAYPMEVRTPDGQKVTVTPFHKVNFDNGSVVVEAEFRMGADGPAGLTRWFFTGPSR